MAVSSMSPQGCSIFGELATSIHQVSLHRHKPGTFSVQNHLGKEPDRGPTLGLLLKVGVRGVLEGEKEGTVTSLMRMTSSHFCLVVQLLQPPTQAQAEAAACNWQLFLMVQLRSHPQPPPPAPTTHPRCLQKPYGFGFFRNVP